MLTECIPPTWGAEWSLPGSLKSRVLGANHVALSWKAPQKCEAFVMQVGPVYSAHSAVTSVKYCSTHSLRSLSVPKP